MKNMKKKTAKFIKNKSIVNKSEAKVYKVKPKIEGNRYVVSSAIHEYIRETYLFASNKKGNITDWIELEGSQKNVVNCEKVLTDLGYIIK